MATSFLGISASPLSLARGASTLIGAFVAIMSVRAILDPSSYATQFGFSPHSTSTNLAGSNPFIFVLAGRGLATSATLLGCVYLRCDKGLGLFLASASIAGLFDGLSLIWYTDQNGVELEEQRKVAWGHWVVTSVLSALGLWTVINT
ncbi:hypothetical protein F4779DRAFT_586292 [Xylariaceae sp. FL0662B]|nr:hypothetical protein F4779DRAFT_586292 [Xylariaceae sp. FL0662B]